jgi:hypothetical protein
MAAIQLNNDQWFALLLRNYYCTAKTAATMLKYKKTSSLPYFGILTACSLLLTTVCLVV